jgi:predicted ATP-grasp superfamily ATP-dependent carboligase
VLKPDEGAGSTATFLLAGPDDLAPCLAVARREGFDESQLLLQDYCPGRAASVAFLAGPGARVPLVPTFQILSTDGRFHYRGGELPVPPELAERAVKLGRRASECVPGWLGYFGVDLILGEAADGSEDRAIEINPRLTTSYVGLRCLADFNLAEVMLRVARGEAVGGLRWRAGGARFGADGGVARIAESDYRF